MEFKLVHVRESWVALGRSSHGGGECLDQFVVLFQWCLRTDIDTVTVSVSLSFALRPIDDAYVLLPRGHGTFLISHVEYLIDGHGPDTNHGCRCGYVYGQSSGRTSCRDDGYAIQNTISCPVSRAVAISHEIAHAANTSARAHGANTTTNKYDCTK
jgi:hypothetical protein